MGKQQIIVNTLIKNYLHSSMKMAMKSTVYEWRL